MAAHFAPDNVICHAGLVMAQAANIASVLDVGELICPFAVVTKGDSRESINFEAPTQDEAISEGWASFEKYKEYFDLWALAREGLMRGSSGKDDVLVVAAWTHGMSEPVVFVQRFLPKGKGGFALETSLQSLARRYTGGAQLLLLWRCSRVRRKPQRTANAALPTAEASIGRYTTVLNDEAEN